MTHWLTRPRLGIVKYDILIIIDVLYLGFRGPLQPKAKEGPKPSRQSERHLELGTWGA